MTEYLDDETIKAKALKRWKRESKNVLPTHIYIRYDPHNERFGDIYLEEKYGDEGTDENGWDIAQAACYRFNRVTGKMWQNFHKHSCGYMKNAIFPDGNPNLATKG